MSTSTACPEGIQPESPLITQELERIEKLKSMLHFMARNSKRSLKSIKLTYEHKRFGDSGLAFIENMGALDDLIPGIEELLHAKIAEHQEIVKKLRG